MTALSRRALFRGGLAGALPLPSFDEQRTTIFVFLRGGADALSLLVPYASGAYYEARPRLAIAPPSRREHSALALDAQLGLHPCLPSLKRAFDAGELGVIAGVGSSPASHAHSEATRAVHAAIVAALGGIEPEPPCGALESDLLRLARRVRSRSAPRAAIVESFGWDTHVAQGAGMEGRFASCARALDAALEAFRVAVGEDLARARLIVLSEFGRSISETRLGGTEDGEASALFVLGGGAPLGVVRGSFGALDIDRDALFPGLDLASELVALTNGVWPS